jgi:hypothetical protein
MKVMRVCGARGAKDCGSTFKNKLACVGNGIVEAVETGL